MNTIAKPVYSAIACMAENRVIGKENQLPWHLPADLKRFKAITTGHIVLMGRKTYQSIGKPLPNRTNLIMTRDKNLEIPGCVMAHSIEEISKKAQLNNEKEIFIIGGAEIYQQFLPYLQFIYLTIVHQHLDGDAYFPLLDMSKWQEIEKTRFKADEHHAYDYSFLKLASVLPKQL